MAQAFISQDPNIADEFPESQQEKVLSGIVKKEKQSSLTSFNSNKTVINSASSFSSPLGIASVLTGGARNPVFIGLFSESPLFSPKPEISKLSRVNAIQYSYNLNGYLDNDKISVFPAGTSSFVAAIYYTLTTFNFMNAGYDNALAGAPVRKDKFVTLNSYRIGTIRYNQPGLGLGFFRIEDEQGNDTLADRIDWTVPIDNRPVASDGGDFFAYDFEKTDPRKITKEQLEKIKNGQLTNLVSCVTVDMTGQSLANTNFVNQLGALDKALVMYGHVVFEIFGVAVSYTPEI